MMNRKLVFLILLIFCSGMLMGCVSASHTYHKGGYTFTVSDSQYNKIQKLKKGDHSVVLSPKVKTTSYKNVKVPVYKNKKVTKSKWKYKTVWVGTDYSDGFGNVYKKVTNKNYMSAYKGGWKYYKSFYKENRKTGVCKYYSTLKKKVYYTGTKKVQSGYKIVKCPVYARFYVTGWKPYVDFCAMKGNAYQVLNDYNRYPL